MHLRHLVKERKNRIQQLYRRIDGKSGNIKFDLF